jgi:hypothetical protein
MSDYRLEFNSVTGPNDTDRLNYLLSIVSEEDRLEIVMEDDDGQVDSIKNTLEASEFGIIGVDRDSSGRYHIAARRNSEEELF